MNFLLDENCPRSLVVGLRASGHEVVWVRETSPGISDREVLEQAYQGHRVLMTFDKDFGELAWRHGLPASAGIILIRLDVRDPISLAGQLVDLLDAHPGWEGHFTVVQSDRIRRRPLAGP